MNYTEALQYIHQTPKFSRELGNQLLEKLLIYCGNPEKKLKFVHIAGTNGKGSTAIMLSKILHESGYKTGLFISPYIERFNERIQLNNTVIPDKDLAEIITMLKAKIERYETPVSEFALDTAAALCWFERNKPDIVILETGLGGRLDATNIIPENLVSVITRIGLDHTQYLGETYAAIAREKCGIIKQHSPVVSYPLQEEEALAVIMEEAQKKSCPLYIADVPTPTKEGMQLNHVTYPLGLQGEFQIYNAATVLKTIQVLQNQGWHISDDAIFHGLKHAQNPSRFEQIGDRIILDGAHNPQAIQELCMALKKKNRPIYFCVAMMEDKDYAACVEILSKYAQGVVVTELPMPRCCSTETLASAFHNNKMEEVAKEKVPEQALRRMLSMAPKNGIICICGSLYLAGTLRPYIFSQDI